jgi:NAD(P)-dependent dehydrogenase (short-subunit alcohol dehydrogenase family)
LVGSRKVAKNSFLQKQMDKKMTKTAVITGATGGLGKATSEHLLAHGWQVVVADFDREALAAMEGQKNVTPVFVDVSDTNSVEAALAEVSKTIDGLDAIVNFAGILAVGSMVEMDEAVLQRVLDVNVMGTFRVNKAFFPLLKARKGRIVNISSETGWQSGGPFNGAYAASKHCIEAYSDSLRRELALLDIAVIKVQPGPFKTEMVSSIEGNFSRAIETSSNFKKVLAGLKDKAVAESKKGNDPAELAAVIYTALTSNSPKAAYSVKPDLARSLLEYLPTSWADALIKKVLSAD